MLDYMQLSHLRLLHELTQNEIAIELGITRNYISMVENNLKPITQAWHDNYIKTIYILHTRKNNNVSVSDNIEETSNEINKEEIPTQEKTIKKVADKTPEEKVEPKKTIKKPTTKDKAK